MITPTFITRTLSDIMPGYDEFDAEVMEKLNFDMTDDEKEYLFTLVYAKYADSHVRYTNEDLFLLNLRKEIMVLYPAVLAMIRDQKKLRDGTDEDFMKGGRAIINAAAGNTSINFPNDTTKGIPQLDSQQIQNNERAKIDILFQRMDMYKSNMENKFLEAFNKYFVQIIAPQRDLLYITTAEEEASEEE